MSTLITLVGKQPGAVATTAKTLLKKASLKQIILLYTHGTQDEHTRLRNYFETIKRDFNDLKIESSVIATDLDNPGNYPFAWNIISEKIKDGQLPEPIYYDTSPGLNYQVALISYHLHLRKETRITPLYADYRFLYNLTASESSGLGELEDIGFEELLRLYGLQADKSPDSQGIVGEVTISGGDKPLKNLLRACERKGRLHGLYRIFRNVDEPERERESGRIKQEARKIEAFLESPMLLNNLQPRIVVWTNEIFVNDRLKAYGVQTVLDQNYSLSDIVDIWNKKQSQPPGLFKPGEGETQIIGKEELLFPNGNWTGKNLLVALGADPSSTLLAIYTHKPEKIIILFDKNNPWIKAIAGRIKQFREKIPAKLITFWPTDIMGDIENDSKLMEVLNERNWIANITPGTKSQTWNLARFNNVEIWSLNNQTRTAEPLILTENPLNPVPFSYPPIFLQASVNGGILKDEGLSREGIDTQMCFFRRINNVIAKEAQKPSRHASPIPLSWQPGTRYPPKGNEYIECTELADKEIKFNTCSEQQKINGTIRCDDPTDSGKWLEEPVAAAFMLACGKENIKDIKIGVKWDWLNNKPTGNHFRTEMDIILLWNGHYIGISCKRGGGSDETLEKHRAEIMAEARAGLGRFAIPILVRGNISKNKAKKVAEESILDGPLEIGLCLLNNGQELKKLVEMAIKRYHTLSQSSE